MIVVSISPAINSQLCVYLRHYLRFASIVTVCISPSIDITFTVVNDNKSCFSSIKLHSSRVSRSTLLESSHQSFSDDQIFLQAYPQPLKPFYHFLSRLKECPEIGFEFTQFTLRTFSEPLAGLTASWQRFAVGWFHFLVEGISTSGLLSKSTLVIKASSSFGIKMIIPGPNQAEIDVGAFNFTSSRFHDDTCSIVVSLKEFMVLMNLASSLHSLINISFGSHGLPLLASLNSINGIECKFVFATISIEQIPEKLDFADREVDHISGTDSEPE